MSDDKSKEVGKQIGKVFSKLINVTSAYCNFAVNSITSAYEGFTEEATKSTLSKKDSREDINACVESELKNVTKKDSAEL